MDEKNLLLNMVVASTEEKFNPTVKGESNVNTNEELMRQLAELQEMVARLSAGQQIMTTKGETMNDDELKKGARPVKPKEGRTYQLLLEELPLWGKVPQQQRDLAAILLDHMAVGELYSEAEVFGFLTEDAANYTSLRTSKMHVTYLFAYYRAFSKKDTVHGSFFKRNFLRMNG